MTIDEIKGRRDMLVAEIEKWNGAMVRDTNQCRCPFHDDRTPSAGISNVGGAWVFCCQTCLDSGHFHGGSVIDLRMKKRGITMKEALKELGFKPSPAPLPRNALGAVSGLPTLNGHRPLPPLPTSLGAPVSGANGTHSNGTAYRQSFPTVDALLEKHRTDGSYVAHWEYTNPETGKPDLIVMRWQNDGKKSYKQASPVPGGYAFCGMEGKFPLYNRERIAAATNILVVEGEKCADIANTLLPKDYAATTAPGGAGKAHLADWTPLAGKCVTLWPDNDESGKGQKHMDEVANILNALSKKPSVSMIDLSMLTVGNKGDIEQWANCFPDSHDLSPQLIEEMKNSEPCGASRSLKTRMSKIHRGEYRVVKYPMGFDEMTRITNGTLPGTTTVWCGWPGSRKSFLTLSFYLNWHIEGHKVALLELEEDRAFWLQRALAVVSKDNRVMDVEWTERNRTESSEIFNKNQKVLDSFGDRVTECDEEKTQDWCVDWVRQQAEDKCRFILVDPISMLVIDGPDQARQDLRFVTRIKNIAKEYGCSIDLVTHPPKSAAQTKGRTLSLADVSGGSAYTRYSQTVFWVEGCKKKVFQVEKNKMFPTPECNSLVTVVKARNGTGSYRVIGADFNSSTLCFAEQGVIAEEGK